MREKRTPGLVALLAAIVLMPTASLAQNEVVQFLDNGTINWSASRVFAKGIGAPPANAVNMAQSSQMAKQAALLDARRNLLAITRGVQLDSLAVVKNAIGQSDLIGNSLQSATRNAQVVDTAYMSDGSVEVTIAMSMTGEFADILLPGSPGSAHSLTPISTPGSAVPASPPARSDVFTGLVLDARGLGTRPAMSPKILNQSGKEIYGSTMVDREFAVQHGMAGYARELSTAQENGRVTANPLTLRALGASGQARTDIIIPDSDAMKLLSVAENMSFLQKCRVMIVLD